MSDSLLDILLNEGLNLPSTDDQVDIDAVLAKTCGRRFPVVDDSAWRRSHQQLRKNAWGLVEPEAADADVLAKSAAEQRQRMLRAYEQRDNSLAARFASLLEQLRAFFTPEEAYQAEKAARALDVALFAQLAEQALARAQ
jgi:hypothetical protein